MTKEATLKLIRVIHTLTWLFFNLSQDKPDAGILVNQPQQAIGVAICYHDSGVNKIYLSGNTGIMSNFN